MVHHFISLFEYDGSWIDHVLKKAADLKAHPQKYSSAFKNKTLAMLFMKTSTRTRCSFEAGMTQLGGHAMFLDVRATNYTLGSLEDETKCLARYADIIMARVFAHAQIQAMAKSSRVPVINGLCDIYHPCQALADLLTIKEKVGRLKGATLAFIGDGNNVCNSLIIAGCKTGMKVRVATPKGYEPAKHVVAFGKKHGLFLTRNPVEALKGADAVYTDTWVSMGQEKEKQKRLRAFKGFQLNMNLLKKSGVPRAYVMHCLPAHRGVEISDDALDSKNSVVYDQAENRMHVQKAVMLKLMGKF